MTYRDALSYLDSLVNLERRSDYDYRESLKLDRMRRFAALLGNPHKGMASIHVSGTKGKGSVAAFVNSILTEAGYRVGLYTSPHLLSFRERIRIGDEVISESEVASVMDEIKPALDEMDKEGSSPTYFDVCTMMAFIYFRRARVDFTVLEVGMGGRLDSTNIADSMISVITPVSFDHTKYLGSTLGEIAFEKCGVIKDGTTVISALQYAEVMKVISETAVSKRCGLTVLSRDLFFEIHDSSIRGQQFSLLTKSCEYTFLRIKMLGDFQVENAALAVAVAEALKPKGVFIKKDVIKSGLAKARWPGRLEVIATEPTTVVDGAQNAASAMRLKKALLRVFGYRRLILIFGAMCDKDIDGMLRQISDLASTVIVTRPNSERAASSVDILGKLIKYKDEIDVVTTESVKDAILAAGEKAGKDDLILITGSLYLVAEAMQICNKGDVSLSPKPLQNKDLESTLDRSGMDSPSSHDFHGAEK